MSPSFLPRSAAAVPVFVLEQDDLADWLATRSAQEVAWINGSAFKGALGQMLLLPGTDGTPKAALAGYGTVSARSRGRFHLAGVAAQLPKGVYALEGLSADRAAEEALGWLLATYRFDRYREQKPVEAQLVAPEGVDANRLETIAAAEFLTRDLINTPTADMGPSALEAAAVTLAESHNAQIRVTRGAALVEASFPMIHAVGRAAAEEPRLIDLSWGEAGPALTLVGKGVCFDTGGLNIKPGSSMALMKKDMGGAATVLGLAQMIMALALPLRLRVLIPAVENSISANAFRPGDILTARNGLSVEVNNTDAEGRLVLADALTLGAEDAPDLMVSMATLTGAARVALGPDIAPFFCDDAALASALEAAGQRVADPVWRLPLHSPYEAMIEPGIADLDNAPKGGFAGAITAALFLRRFVGDTRYLHFDIYGWTPTAAPARPKGGVGMGARALLDALPEILGL